MQNFTLEQLNDLSIDSLITKQRDHYALRLADAVDIADLKNHSVGDGVVKQELTEWFLFVFSNVPAGHDLIILAGTSADDGTEWCTSPVVAINLEAGYVRTRSGSLYKISGPATSKPSLRQLMHISGTFAFWGIADYLGMPAVFY